MMRMKLRSPLMIQQVMEMMENSRFDGPLEFHHYWDGYVSALRDAGMITEKGEESLREFSTEINDACMYEPEDEPAVDPKALMQEIASRYPMALAEGKVADVVSTIDYAGPTEEILTAEHAALGVAPDVVSIIATPAAPQDAMPPTSATPARRTVRR